MPSDTKPTAEERAADLEKCPKCGAPGQNMGAPGVVSRDADLWVCTRDGCPRTWEVIPAHRPQPAAVDDEMHGRVGRTRPL
jgi:hypothetical protein